MGASVHKANTDEASKPSGDSAVYMGTTYRFYAQAENPAFLVGLIVQGAMHRRVYHTLKTVWRVNLFAQASSRPRRQLYIDFSGSIIMCSVRGHIYIYNSNWLLDLRRLSRDPGETLRLSPVILMFVLNTSFLAPSFVIASF